MIASLNRMFTANNTKERGHPSVYEKFKACALKTKRD